MRKSDAWRLVAIAITIAALPASAALAWDAVVLWSGTNKGKAYIFDGNQYIRYNAGADIADEGYPKTLDSRTWPGVGFSSVDAVINWGNGKAYLFSGDQYIRYDIASDRADPGYPKQINGNTWPGLGFSRVDAAINWGNGKAYFFSGNQYMRYDINADAADPGYPKWIDNDTWPGLGFSSVDAAVNWSNGKAYFFSGNQYVRYDIASDRADRDYPREINNSTWPGAPANFYTPPQSYAVASPSCGLPEDAPLDCDALVNLQDLDFPLDQQGEPIIISDMDVASYADACDAAASKQLSAMHNSINAYIDASVGGQPPLTRDDAATWKKHLLDTQRGWLKFKENECEMEWFRWRGGTIRLSAGANCRADLTVSRLNGWRSEYPEAWASLCSR